MDKAMTPTKPEKEKISSQRLRTTPAPVTNRPCSLTFLAKCYVARKEDPKFTDVFLWITWSPFRVTKWNQLHSPEEIKKAILDKRNRLRSLNISDTQEAEKALSQEEEFLNSLSKDIWLLVLSKEQEDFLTISREEMGVIAQYRTGKEG